MKALTTPSGNFGPFATIEVLEDRYSCDNTDLPFSVVGTGTIVEADTVTWPVPPVPAADRTALILRIDADADAIIKAVVGERYSEYALAESEAGAYKTAGYTGTVPGSVQGWATAKGQPAQWATDNILTAAAGWRQAQAAIRAKRLLLKEQARTAPDLASVTTQWDGFMRSIKAALGVA